MSAVTAVHMGETLPEIVRHVTQDVIDAYARATGDFNPIHVDPEYAKTGPFGRTIAHGLMTLAFVAEMLNVWSEGRFDGAGEIDVTFVGPVFVGDLVRVGGEVAGMVERDGVACAQIRLTCNAGERPILVGTALQPIANTGEPHRGA